MPYKLQQSGDEWCVVKEGGEKVPGGCHPSRTAALKHMRALYANVEDAQHSAEFVGEVVTRRGKCYAAGEYPDKAFQATAGELQFMRDVFSPVALDLEHKKTILDGKLGRLTSVAPDGDTLFGEVEIPSWLHETHPDPIPISLAFDRETKEIVGAALVLKPRVTDAALMSAYAEFAGRRHSASDLSALQQIHDLAQGQGAECRSTADYSHDAASSGKETQPMPSLWDRFKAALEGVTDEPAGGAGANSAIVAMSSGAEPPAPDPEVKRLRDELAQVQKERAEERRQAHLRQAAAFADAEIAASRAVPAERAEIASAYFQAAQDDSTAPTVVTFADGKTGTRVEGLARLHAARPAHGYTQELVGDPSLVALFNAETTQTSDEDKALDESIRAFGKNLNGKPKQGTPAGGE